MTPLQPKAHGEGFLNKYLHYTKNQESPELFHFWVGLTIISAALGRKCYMDRGAYHLYPNLFTILVAGAANCRKSTAIGMGVKLMEGIVQGPNLTEGIPGVKVIRGKVTPERFIMELATKAITRETRGEKIEVYPSTLVYSSELSVFLSSQQHSQPLIHLLTDLFDCHDLWSYTTKNSGEVYLKDIFISILAATTPSGLAKAVSHASEDEGFASRVMFIYMHASDRCFPDPISLDAQIGRDLKASLARIASMEYQFVRDEAALTWWDTWYRKHHKEIPSDTRVAGLYGRKADQVLRIAMILAASFERYVIHVGDLEAALEIVEHVQQTMPLAFKFVGGNDYTAKYERLTTVCRRFRRITHSELLKRMQPMQADEFKILITTAVQSGLLNQVTEQIGDDGTIKKTRMFYEWNDAGPEDLEG